MYATQTIDQVLNSLESSVQGLDENEVQARIKKHGFNELPEKKRSLLILFLKQFQSVLVYILFGALALSIALPFFEHGGVLHLKDFIDAIAIASILVINAVLGFVQEKKAENAIAVLKKLSAPNVRVRRRDVVIVIASREVVPGDILLLEEGDRVSADGRIIAARNAAVDEASLTGESKPSQKHTDPIEGDVPIADQANMVFKGTTVTRGRLEVCVTGTGINTELGRIATLVSSVEHPPTPLEQSMAVLGKWIGIVVIFFCIIIFGVGVYYGLDVGQILLAAASLAVSAVPEGLPAIVTVCLAIGVQRMIRVRVLTRELQAIETLGSVTVICSDKTGTITENEMEVQELWANGEEVDVEWGDGNATVELKRKSDGKDAREDVELLLTIGMSCNNAHSLDVGDPTEIGLLEVAQVANVERLDILEEDEPFSSDTKYMMTSHEVSGSRYQVLGDVSQVKFIKGAPEVVVDMCDLSPQEKEAVQKQNEKMAGDALRVLAMAYKSEDKTTFVGLIGMLDPARDGVKEAIAMAKRAGIRTVMITGDHALTAKAVGNFIGIESDVIRGPDIKEMSDEKLQEAVKTTSIFARVSPTHKVKILEALQAHGEVVAMGGDGVNDAPALKRANVGFAMGIQGTDVARETAEIVLTDDNFSSVVEAVEEGRTIYDNIRKFVGYLLRVNFKEMTVLLITMIAGLPLPYLPIHLLLINLATDSLPALALSMEKAEPDVMNRPPRPPREHILHGEVKAIALTVIVGTISVLHVFMLWLGKTDGDADLARSIVLATTITFELLFVFTCRSHRSLLSIGAFSNRYLLGAVAISFGVLFACLYTPLNTFLHLVPLTLEQWVWPVVWGFGSLVLFEALKLLPSKRG